jgi:23S rRNA (guanosine2251-2'-O)-methyltransferase
MKLEVIMDLLSYLDHIEDPHNFGAIIRTAEAAGVDAIIIPKDRSVDVNSTVMKTSAGALENMKVVQVTNLTNTIKELKQKGYWFVATDMEGTDYDKVDYKGNIAIVIGNEGSGISRLVKENCDFVATIPMTGSINSLNASVAAGIILFEALKQRR